jgi:HlyD family secretion protein
LSETTRKRRKKRRWWIPVVLLVVTALVLLQTPMARRLTGRLDKPLEVRVETVQRLDELDSVVSASGQIEARESVDIQTEIAGIIVELPVEEGDRVTAGQVLVKIDPEQTLTDVRGAEAQLQAAEADAESAKARIASARAELAQARFQEKTAQVDLEQTKVSLIRSTANEKRKRDLFERKLASIDEYEIAEMDSRLDQARVAAAEAGIEQALARIEAFETGIEQAEAQFTASLSRALASKAAVERIRDLLSKTTIRSPIDGLIVRRNVDPGERAVPGVLSNPQATLLTIADLSSVEAHIEVDETDIVNVSLGDLAKVVVDALPDDELTGKVTEIGNSPIAVGTNVAKDFKVKVRLDEPPSVLRPGLSCTAEITTDTKTDILVVPIAALVIREVYVDDAGAYEEPVKKAGVEKPAGGVQAASGGDGSKTKDARKKKELEGVFVMDAEGLARFRPVETGITGEIEIEIKKGLEEGEIVITGPYKTLRSLEDGTRINASDKDAGDDEKKR